MRIEAISNRIDALEKKNRDRTGLPLIVEPVDDGEYVSIGPAHYGEVFSEIEIREYRSPVIIEDV